MVRISWHWLDRVLGTDRASPDAAHCSETPRRGETMHSFLPLSMVLLFILLLGPRIAKFTCGVAYIYIRWYLNIIPIYIGGYVYHFLVHYEQIKENV